MNVKVHKGCTAASSSKPPDFVVPDTQDIPVCSHCSGVLQQQILEQPGCGGAYVQTPCLSLLPARTLMWGTWWSHRTSRGQGCGLLHRIRPTRPSSNSRRTGGTARVRFISSSIDGGPGVFQSPQRTSCGCVWPNAAAHATHATHCSLHIAQHLDRSPEARHSSMACSCDLDPLLQDMPPLNNASMTGCADDDDGRRGAGSLPTYL
jgi:hypothetical protein